MTRPLAYQNDDFLEGEDGRPLRILAEYLEPLRRFKAQRIQDTVVFFGSARIHGPDDAAPSVDGPPHAAGRLPARPPAGHGRKHGEWSRYYDEARALARLLTAWSVSLDTPHHRFVVTTGGGPGIMEAANRGAAEAGGKTIGLNIRLPYEQVPNAFITDGLDFQFRYFFMRKFWFAYLAKALVVFPGGFGTLDEMFEILTLMQTEKLAKQIQIILYGSAYWETILSLDPMADWGAIDEADIGLIERADTPQQAFDLLKAHLMAHHLVAPAGEAMQAPGIARTRS